MYHKPTAAVTIVLAKAHIFTRCKGAGKAIYEILTAAAAILLPMTGPRVNHNLFQHGSVWPSPQRGGNYIRSRLLRRVCHAAPIWNRFWPKSHAVCYAQTLSRGTNAPSNP